MNKHRQCSVKQNAIFVFQEKEKHILYLPHVRTQQYVCAHVHIHTHMPTSEHNIHLYQLLIYWGNKLFLFLILSMTTIQNQNDGRGT